MEEDKAVETEIVANDPREQNFEDTIKDIVKSAASSFKGYENDKKELSKELLCRMESMTNPELLEYYKLLHSASNEAFSRLSTPLLALSGIQQQEIENVTEKDEVNELDFESFQTKEKVGKKILQGITTLISVAERIQDDEAIKQEIEREREDVTD